MCVFHSSKRKKFIPDQFATYHFRRKNVSGSYIYFDPTEPHKDKEDISEDDDSDEGTTMVLLADDGLSDERKEAAPYEQLPSTKKNIKSLSESDIKK